VMCTPTHLLNIQRLHSACRCLLTTPSHRRSTLSHQAFSVTGPTLSQEKDPAGQTKFYLQTYLWRHLLNWFYCSFNFVITFPICTWHSKLCIQVLLLLLLLSGTCIKNKSETPTALSPHSGSLWRHSYSTSISVFSASEVYTIMCYINSHFTYLLVTYGNPTTNCI